MKWTALVLLIFCGFLSLNWTYQSQVQKAARRPNVLFILTDDQGWGDLSLHGNPYLETPTLDNLARQGAQFDRFYVSPLCAPTRASLLTGRYHLRTGTVSVSRGLEVMNAEETTLAELFKENGYTTGCYGKWHNGEHYPNHPNGQGFDDFFGFCAGHWTNYFDTELEHNGRMIRTKGYITDVLTDAALQFIDKNKDRPFFCYVPYNAPHSPHQVPDAYFNKYKKRGLDDEVASIYGMVENVDDNVRRLLDKLKQEGLEENTIVIFATDNGPNGVRYNGDMKGIKGHVDEGGVRVPFFVKWPGKIVPKTIRSLAAHIDLLPTLVELCSLQTTEKLLLDGVSLAKQVLATQETPLPDRPLFTHVAHLDKALRPQPGAVRTSQYRWVWKSTAPELYDMMADPAQKNNIAAGNPAVTTQLSEAYQRWFEAATQTLRLAARPVPAGYAQKKVELAAHEADFKGNLKYKEGHGWAHDWLVNWTSPADTIWWTLESRAPITYDVYLRYTVPGGQTGSIVQVLTGEQVIQQKITQAIDPPIIPSPDRVMRKEVYEKEWGLLRLGPLSLPAGKSRISLMAPRLASQQVAEFKSLVLVPATKK
ncbi:arylsulfatase [Telluribacter sp.]|uniref:arylsulfatase n=1 Tax=Telluribacter sp. TaxID=1978767 RepID=UPI002E11FBB5|nr:arylsulfatase [Telluribacter sp.]